MASMLPARYRVTTDPLRTARRLELVLLALLAVLLLQLAWGGLRLASLEQPESVLPAADSLQVRQLLKVAQVEPAQRAQLRERPLFWASRRPQGAADSVAAKEDKKVGEIAGVRLVGVFGSGDSAGIIVTLKESGRKRLLIGEKVNGWKLLSVSGNEAVLSASGRKKTLTLQVASGDGTSKAKAKSRGKNSLRSARAR